MPSVHIKENIQLWLQYTRSIFNGLPIELQLIWLYEIIVRICLADNPSAFKTKEDYLVINLNKFYKLMTPSAKMKRALSILYIFRNHFVHLGYYNISGDWNDCLCNKKSIDALAKQYGVSLNWSKTVSLEMM